MKRKMFLVSIAVSLFALPVIGATITFDFDTAPLHANLPLDQTVDGVTAHLAGTGNGFSIQNADVLGFTPAGFSGRCIYPNSVFPADLEVSFSQGLTGFSILYAPEEYATDSSATMKVTAYFNDALIGWSTYSIDPPGTWPSGTLAIATGSLFNRVVVHYEAPPVTGGDYGPIFMADNMTVVTPQASVPETLSTGWTLLVLVLGAVGPFAWRKR